MSMSYNHLFSDKKRKNRYFSRSWEFLIHLKRVIGGSTFTFKEMSTLLATIEACMNSRLLAALNDNPNDLQDQWCRCQRNQLWISILTVCRDGVSVAMAKSIKGQFLGSMAKMLSSWTSNSIQVGQTVAEHQESINGSYNVWINSTNSMAISTDHRNISRGWWISSNWEAQDRKFSIKASDNKINFVTGQCKLLLY